MFSKGKEHLLHSVFVEGHKEGSKNVYRMLTLVSIFRNCVTPTVCNWSLLIVLPKVRQHTLDYKMYYPKHFLSKNSF